jgi:two-component system response regulator MprA
MPTLQHRPATIRPSRGPASASDSSESAPLHGIGRTGSTILLVDDDPAVREGLRRVLMSGGWEIISAAGGEEALEYLQAHQPDLMITDLSMAAVSGWDLLFHENLQRPDLPIFVITALPLTSTGGADRFAHEFFQKPIDLDALLAAVRHYIGAPRGADASI